MSYTIAKYIKINKKDRTYNILGACNNVSPKTYEYYQHDISLDYLLYALDYLLYAFATRSTQYGGSSDKKLALVKSLAEKYRRILGDEFYDVYDSLVNWDFSKTTNRGTLSFKTKEEIAKDLKQLSVLALSSTYYKERYATMLKHLNNYEAYCQKITDSQNGFITELLNN